MDRTRALECLCLLAVAAAPARGQECRKLTAAETAAAAKVSDGVKRTVEGALTALGWTLATRKSDRIPLSIGTSPKPPRPLFSCWPLYAATFTMTAASPRYAALRAAADKGMAVETAWMGACLKTLKGCDAKPAEAAAGERATAAMSLEVRVTENDPFMRGPRSEPARKLEVTGAAVAFAAPDEDPALTATTLCFGDWKPEVVFASGKAPVAFPFKHGTLTPFIENMCVVVRAAPETAAEFVSKADWKPLTAALTR